LPSPLSHGFHHRNAEELRQLRGVDLLAAFAHLVHHVEGEDHGDAELHELDGEVEVPLEAVGVDDVDHQLRPLVDEVVAGDQLFLGIGGQGIGAGQIDDVEAVPVGLEVALALLHGDAGIVPHALPRAREGVEHGRFSGIGVTRKRNAQRLRHGHARLRQLPR
jgi:hypothetical protein